jgi:hypothetical protein
VVPIKEFLYNVDPTELHEKICSFRLLDFKKLSYQDVQSQILKVITFNTPSGSRSVLTPSMSSYPTGTKFYRVRPLAEDDRKLPLRDMGLISDCWEPPNSIVKAGRLNKAKEALLYTAPMYPSIAVEELKIPDNQLFSLIVYEAIEPINVTSIGLPYNGPTLSKENLLKHRMIQDFLHHEFARDVGEGTEYLYKISESIVKDYFDLPPELHDAWCYPSVAKKGGCNDCFRSTSRDKIKLHGVQIASVSRSESDYLFQVKIIAKDSGNGINLSYHEMGSLEQQDLFPEFELNAM